MLIFTLRRLGYAVLVTITVSVVTFTLLRLSGDPAAALAGEAATTEDIEYVRRHYGFDKPLPLQYWDWATRALQGDFGISVYLKEKPVSDIIIERAPVTMKLGFFAISFAILLGIPLGVLAAMRPNTLVDRVALTIAVFGQAMPSFFFGLTLIFILAVTYRILPSSGSTTLAHFIMPSIALGYYAMPAIMRLTRAGMMEVLASDYIRTARAKGLRTYVVLFKHALRNAIIPVVSLSAAQLGFMLGGSVVIESIFTINGLGRAALQSIFRSDFEVMQAIVLTISVFYIGFNLLADLLNAFLDPRIRVH
ncbi:MAG: ABC transporter permease [Alphaproteobacteria bacterium]|nr:ABC transporter permease [Alphaproteobacteria bacterium]